MLLFKVIQTVRVVVCGLDCFPGAVRGTARIEHESRGVP